MFPLPNVETVTVTGWKDITYLAAAGASYLNSMGLLYGFAANAVTDFRQV